MNSIIAYRNPLEQWAWESGAIWVIVPVFVIGVVAFWILTND
jgi:hypothetical protein